MASKSGAVRAGRAFVEFFADDSKLVRGMKSIKARLSSFGNSVKAMGRQMLAFGTLAAVPLALATVAGAKFEYQMSRVKALTGATGETFKMLEDKARDLGRDTVFSATEAAEAMSFFALAGYDANRIMEAIGPTLDLAAAGQIGIAEAADIAAKVMAGMGIEASEFGATVDVMAKAMTTANTDMLMLGEAFKFVGPMAKVAGVSMEEITAEIQLLSNAGIQGEMAGTTLRGVILSLTSPSKEASDALKELGVRVNDEKGNFRGLVPIITDLESAMQGMGSGARLEKLGTIFPARQAAGAAELVSQGAGKLAEATAALNDSAGTASRIAAVQLDNLAGDCIILTSALEGVAIAAEKAFGPILRTSAQYVAKLLVNLEGWIDANQGTVAAVGLAVVGIAALGGALVALGVAINVTSFAIGALATVIAYTSAAIGFLLSPVGLLIAGLAAGVAAFVAFTDAGKEMGAGIGGIFGFIASDALRSFAVIKDALAAGDWGTAAALAWSFIKAEWASGVGWIKSLWTGLKSEIIAIWNTVQNAISTAWVHTVSFLGDSLTAVVSGFESAWVKAYSAIAEAGAWAFADTPEGVERLREDIRRQKGVKLDAINGQRDAEITESERKRKAVLEELDAQAKRDDADRLAAEAAGKKAIEDDIAAKRQAHEKALADARKALEEKDAEDQAKAEEQRKAVQAAQDGAADTPAAGVLTTAEGGTFSALAEQMFAFTGQDYAKDTARNTAETAKGVKKLAGKQLAYGK